MLCNKRRILLIDAPRNPAGFLERVYGAEFESTCSTEGFAHQVTKSPWFTGCKLPCSTIARHLPFVVRPPRTPGESASDAGSRNAKSGADSGSSSSASVGTLEMLLLDGEVVGEFQAIVEDKGGPKS